MSAANPLHICYASDAHLYIEQFAGTTGIAISGQRSDNTLAAEWQRARSRGTEVLEYRIHIERPNSRVSEFDESCFMGDASKVPLWPYLDANHNQRCQNATTKLTDIRVGSPWVTWCVDNIAELIRTKRCDGVFLDGFGGQLWGAAGWNGWPVGEQQEWQAGAVDFARRLDEMRRAENAGFIFVGNNSWQYSPAGEKYMDGICIENLPPTSGANRALAARTYGSLGHRRVLTISRTDADAIAWAAAPGVTHVCSTEENSLAGRSRYSRPTKPAVGYTNLQTAERLAYLLRQLDDAKFDLAKAVGERDAAIEQRNTWMGEYDAVVRERDAARVAYDSAVAREAAAAAAAYKLQDKINSIRSILS